MAVFADLGTPRPKVLEKGTTLIVQMYRNGNELRLGFHDHGAGKVVEQYGRERRVHASYVALLASERFGDLRRWAQTQSMLLRESLVGIDPKHGGIEISGTLAETDDELDVSQLDEFLSVPVSSDSSVQVMLLDGPAGIGKTKFIEMIALSRALHYAQSGRPLLLHVQSRGRVLSYLQDLMAFSLQRLRLMVTFDQLPVLARHGLVTLAIDGFDELGDPNGYDLAWGQFNDTLTQVRGQSTVILAGRETFIGLERLKQALPALEQQDTVRSLTLQPPSTRVATRWLRRKGWAQKDIAEISGLLDAGSYALRPFFLAQLAERDVAKKLHESMATNLLSTLVDAMLARESGKFGDAVDSVLTEEMRQQYVRRLLCEIARFMADDQTDIIDDISLSWLVEVALPHGDETDPDVVALLKNRAGVIAFLANDILPDYRRFAHSQLFNYFLSVEAIDAVANNEIPKYVRRNIFSADFIAVFADVFRHTADADPADARRFFDNARKWALDRQSVDRGSRNLGAWLIAALSTIGDLDGGELHVGPLNVDETAAKGTASSAVLRGVTVNQIDICNADIRAWTFESCAVNTAIVDQSTRVSPTFPVPTLIRERSGFRDVDRRDPQSISDWLDEHGRVVQTTNVDLDPSSNHGRMLRLVERGCRSSSFWIPDDTETKVDKFVKDPLWPVVRQLLAKHGFLREQKMGVSGRNTRFVHIKHTERLLANDPDDEEVALFYGDIAKIEG